MNTDTLLFLRLFLGEPPKLNGKDALSAMSFILIFEALLLNGFAKIKLCGFDICRTSLSSAWIGNVTVCLIASFCSNLLDTWEILVYMPVWWSLDADVEMTGLWF